MTDNSSTSSSSNKGGSAQTQPNPQKQSASESSSAVSVVKSPTSSTGSSAPPVNAWVRKPNIQPDASAASNIQSITVQQSSVNGGGRDSLPPRKYNRSSMSSGSSGGAPRGNSRRYSGHYNNNNGGGASGQQYYHQGKHYGGSATMPSSAASSAAHLPRHPQQPPQQQQQFEQSYAKATGESRYQQSVNGNAAHYPQQPQMTGAVPPPSMSLKFGTFSNAESANSNDDQTSEVSSQNASAETSSNSTQPVVQVQAFRQNPMAFDSIQRVRSAPPNVSEQEKMKQHHQQLQQQQQQHPGRYPPQPAPQPSLKVTGQPQRPPAPPAHSHSHQGHQQPKMNNNNNQQSRPMRIPNNMMNPGAQSFSPIHYPPQMIIYPPGYYPMMPPHPAGPGAPPYLPAGAPPTGAPFVQNPPPVVDGQTPAGPPGAAPPPPRPPFVPEFVPRPPMMAAPAPVVAPTPGAGSGASESLKTTDFKLAKSKAIKLVNPDTKEEVQLPIKEKKTVTLSSATSNTDSTENSTAPVKSETPAPPPPVKKEVKPVVPVPVVPATTPKSSPSKEVKPVDVKPSPSKAIEIKQSPSKAIEIKPSPSKAVEIKPAPSKAIEIKAPSTPNKSEKPSSPVAKAPSPAKPVQPAQEKPRDTEEKPSKIKYSIEFLLKFRNVCTKRPEGMPIVDLVIGDDGQQNNRRSSKRMDRHSSSGDQSRSRHSEIGTRSTGRGGLRHSQGKYPPGLGPARQSMGGPGSRRSGRNSRQSMQEKEDFNALKTENGWRPTSLQPREEEDPLQIYEKHVRSLLNKLTVEKFAAISEQIKNLQVNRFEELKILIESIFEKAINETKFAGMYGQLCHKLVNQLPDFSAEQKQELAMTAEQSKKGMFRRALLMTCQVEFQKKSEWTNNEDIRLTDDMTKEELETYIAANAKRRQLKQRTLGNIRFIGELFKLSLLNEKIMHECIFHLLRNVDQPEEEEMESVCDLMMVVGQLLDHEKAKENMDQYFSRMEKASKNTSLVSRVRFKIMDVLELRQRKWVVRSRQQKMNAGPMKIKDIYKTPTSQEEMIQELKQREKQSRGPSARASSSWNTTGGDKKGKSRPEKGGKKDGKSIKKGGTPLPEAADSKSASKESLVSNESIKEPTNIFDALQDMESAGGHANGPETPSTSFFEPPKNIVEAEQVKKFIERQLVKDFCTAAATDGFDAAFDVFVSVRSFVEDDMAEETTEKAMEKLLQDMSAEAFKLLSNKDAEVHVRAFADTMLRIYIHELIPQAKFDSFLENQIFEMPDMAMDIPGLEHCLGYVVAVLIDAQIYGFEFPQSCILRMVEEMGDFTPMARPGFAFVDPPAVAKFYGALLKHLKWLSDNTDEQNENPILESFVPFTGEQAANLYGQDMEKNFSVSQVDAQVLKYPWWGTNNDRLCAIPDASIAEWLTKYGVIDAYAPTLKVLLTINNATFPEIKSKGSNVVKADQVTSIISKAFADSKSKLAFTRIIASFIVQHVFRICLLFTKVSEQGKWIEEEQKWMQKWFAVLKPLTSGSKSDLKLQTEILYSLQRFATCGEPKIIDQYLKRGFDVLYELDVVSEPAFKAWEKDSSRQMDTKEVAMIRGAREFLDWLATAEVEA